MSDSKPCAEHLYKNGSAEVMRGLAMAGWSANKIERYVKRLSRKLKKAGLAADWHYSCGWPVLRIGTPDEPI